MAATLVNAAVVTAVLWSRVDHRLLVAWLIAMIALVMTDIVMPGAMDGLALAREIGTRYPGLPVVLASGYSDAPTDVGAHCCLAKPYRRVDLATMLCRALKG